jgi:asparagine synthase (glutamine-hydrolysing)
MCGITGFIDFKSNTTENDLSQMLSRLNHRGPDASGYKIWNHSKYSLGLGQTRLSIIDLSADSNQPMNRDDLGLNIVYNGEVYNFKEIRDELKSHGYMFKTKSDTEVLLVAYHFWGKECIKRLNGMFAFVIYDFINNQLFIVRDRVGVKPLYIYQTNDLFLFSSELRSFHSHPSFIKSVETNSVASFLKLGFVPSPQSIFRNCNKLEAGTYMKIDLNSREFYAHKYWDYTNLISECKVHTPLPTVLSDVEKLLISSVKYRMISDVPVGVFLSGGYDSSTVAALMQANSTKKIESFSIGFDQREFNEAPYAKAIASHLGLNHNELYCGIDESRILINLIPKVYDEPFGDSSAIPTLLVSKFAASRVKVVLSGDGGDEVFCGYGKYYQEFNNFDRIVNLKGIKFKLLKFLVNKISRPCLLEILPDLYANKLLKVQKVLSEKNHKSKYRYRIEPYNFKEFELNKLFKIFYDEQPNTYDKIPEHSDNASLVDILMSIDFQSNLVDDLLVKVDRAGMSYGLEVREPLLDYRLVEYLARIPSYIKITDITSKYLLKKVAHKYIPEGLINRPKMGFAIPKEKWLKQDLANFTKEVIMDTPSHDLFNRRELEKLLHKFYKKNNLDTEKIWNLLMFQMWWNEWMS